MKNLLLFSVVSVLVLVACKKEPVNQVSLISKNFAEEVEAVQNLSFTFNHDLVSSQKIGQWDSTEYIRFEPKIQGKFQWVSTRELVFSPNGPFLNSQEYKASFKKAILAEAENSKLFLSDELKNELTFHTPYLKAEQLQAYWSKDAGSGKIFIKAQLDFRYAIDAQNLKDKIEVLVDDKSSSFQIETKGESNEMVLWIEPAVSSNEDQLLKIKLKKGIGMSGSAYTTTEEQEMAIVLASRLRLEIADVHSTYEGNEGVISVLTSQELVNSSFQSCFTLDPNISTKITALPNGFEIRGNFQINQIYTLEINTSLEGSLGGKLSENFKKNIGFGDPKPNISFNNNKAIYLSSAGAKNIGLKIINVPKVKVQIYKIYENNILAYLRSNYNDYGYYYDDYYEEDYGYDNSSNNYREDYSGDYSSIILEKEMETSQLPKVNGVSALNLSIPEENKKYRGIYFIKVSSSGERYLSATKLVSISDVGLITKVMDDKILVLAHSILTTKPLSNVEINVISRNNQVMLSGKTGSDGVVVFDETGKKAPGFEAAMITARTDEDFNYVPFANTLIETSRFDVGGKYRHNTGFDAYIYGPRNIYRPGETLNFNTIIRKSNWENVGEIPLKMKLVMPNGREFQTLRKNTDKQGSVEASFDIPAAALTGFYHFEVYNANDALLASSTVNIEEFMPDRMRLSSLLNKDHYKPGDTLALTNTATFFYGPPAANKNYEVNYQFSRRDFVSKKYAQFRFYNNSKTHYATDFRQGVTNTQGKFTEKYVLPQSMSNTGIVDAKMYVTVFDESGRPVHNQKKAEVFTQKTYYGIGINDHYVGTNTDMPISFVALDRMDNLKTGARAKIEIYRNEWQSVLENINGSYRYRSKKLEKLILTKTITFSGATNNISFTPLISGEYEIRIFEEGAANYVVSNFYAYGWGTTTSSSFEVNTDGEVTMEFDKEKYKTGEKAKVLFKTPFSGKLFLTIERDKVFEYKIIETDKKSAEWEFTVNDDYMPNIYVTATLFRGMDQSDMPLTVAHGFASVGVEKPDTRLPLEIVSAEKSRSKTKQTIKVKSKPESDIEITLAIVDEGILQIKNFSSPDPHSHFYKKYALEVKSYDIYAYLFPELSGKKSTGGDAEMMAGGDKRANPLANKRVKLVAVWSGVLKTNSKGEAEYTLDIPQYNGELRIMAVAYKNKSFGAASKSMTVADPLVITTARPRFLSPNDQVQMPVTVANTTGKPVNARINMSISGPMSIEGNTDKTIEIPANSETQVMFPLNVNPAIGQGKVTVTVSGLGESFKDETEITIRPSAPLTRHTGNGFAETGTNNLTMSGQTDFLPGSGTATLIISRSPLTQFMDRFKHLIGYPHGCLEQTVSRAFPQIYLSEFIKDNKNFLKVSGENEANPQFNVQEAIRKVSGMQQYSGAMTYWPGQGDYTHWGSIYATHFLLESQKAGYEVNQAVLNKCFDYINSRLASKQTETIWVNENGVNVSKTVANRAQIYSLYIMAMAGKPNRSLMNYYKSNQELLTTDSKYLLGAAFAFIGDKTSFQQITPPRFGMDNGQTEFGGNFSSPLRNLAISLNALMECDPNNPQIAGITKLLSEQLKNRRYANTQELVFSFLALGKIHKKLGRENASAIVTMKGKILGRYDGKKDLTIKDKTMLNNQVSLEVSGGSVYYFWENSGISASGKFVEEDNYLKVRRTYYDRNGRIVTKNTFKQNDLIVVKVSISSSYKSNIENVAITDMLPACFEIENPRVNDLPGIDWITNKFYPQYTDFRDDRANFYMSVHGEKHLYYLVRAVSKGKYVLGPVSADAMYNGEYHSYNGGGTIVVE